MRTDLSSVRSWSPPKLLFGGRSDPVDAADLFVMFFCFPSVQLSRVARQIIDVCPYPRPKVEATICSVGDCAEIRIVQQLREEQHAQLIAAGSHQTKSLRSSVVPIASGEALGQIAKFGFIQLYLIVPVLYVVGLVAAYL